MSKEIPFVGDQYSVPERIASARRRFLGFAAKHVEDLGTSENEFARHSFHISSTKHGLRKKKEQQRSNG